jgi:hypothetical protein
VKRIEDGSEIPETVNDVALEQWADELEQARADYDVALGRVNDAQQRVNELTRTRDQLQAELQSILAELPGVQATIDGTRNQMAALSAQLDEFRAARDAATARLLGTDRANGTVETQSPLLLLPVRLETRFLPARSGAGAQLRVRVYPDDVHIDTHEPGLTEDEERWGRHFWEQAGNAAAGGTPAERMQREWQPLVDRFSAPRAAWITRVLNPAAPLTIDRRQEAWTRAARSQVLPDRWAAVGYRDDQPIVTVWGKPIPDALATGPSPASQTTPAGGNQELPPVDEDMRWMIEFDAAEAKGMALRIPLTDEQARCGFERLIVVGIKAAVDAEGSARRLSDLLDAHHYTNGLAIVPQNVATNNTAEASSGYTSSSGEAGSDVIELGDSLAPAGSDGEAAAHALGVASDVFSHVRDANGTEQGLARSANALLWGILDSPLTRELLALVDPNFLRAHFIDFVRARGPLPAFRVGNQPYGLLPVAALDRWMTPDPTQKPLVDWWRARRQLWRQHAARALSLANGAQPVALLGQEGNACDYRLQKPGDGSPAQADAASLVAASLRDVLMRHASARPHDPALDVLETLPDPIRQPLVAEVLDLATYRFDAWATSLASRRLSELRQERRTGIRLGGYGWVDDLRPGSALQEVVPLPANATGPLYRSEGNKGYLQAPSLAHAATAAVLRSGYLADRPNGDSGDNPFAVDLSSDRVHRAKWLLDGVRQGQPLGALLGYRFERGLHEQGLDRFIHRFRTLAGLKDEDALTIAYENVRKAEQLASEVAALYAQRDQATQRAQDARTIKTERELKRQAYQRELDSINNLEVQANAAAAEAARLERSIAEQRSRKPVSRVDPANRLYRIELVEEVDLEPWTTRLQELTQAREAARHQESSARGAFGVRSASRAGILGEMARLDNRPANPGSIAAAQQIVDAQEALAKDLDRRGLEKEGTRGRAEQSLTAARADLAQQLNRQWARALESLAASNVVDGLELHRRWKAGQRRQPPQPPWDATTIPFGDAALGFPPPGSAEFTSLDAELRALDEWVDAVGDTVVAESVYQIVQGNPLRSGATLDAIASGEMPPPELEVVRTPRSGTALTHRLLLLLPAAAGVAPAAWPINQHQARAQAEPLLNAWAARLLPRPERIRCKADYVDPASGAVHHTLEAALTALQLSPLDALYLAEGNEQAQRSELEQRLVFHLLRSRPASVPAGADLRLRFTRAPDWTEDVVSFGEFIEIARTARKLFAGARALDGRDFLLPGAPAAAALNTNELAQRRGAAEQALAAAQHALQVLLPTEQAERDGAPVELEALRQALLRLAYFGIQGAVPLMAVGDGSEARSALLTQGRSVAKEVEDHRQRLSRLTFDAAHATPEARCEYELARLAEIFGSDFRVVPQLQPANSSDLNEAFAASRTLQGDDPLAAVTWFQRASYVRDGVARLAAAMIYAETSGDGAQLTLQVGQLPHSPSDRWVALPVAPGQAFPGGRLSLVAHTPLSPKAEFDRPLAGLLIDEWVEVVPNRQETTGLTFHFDQPNSAAPQVMLLAISSDRREVWDLDSLGTILRDTMELTRMRAAAPDIRAEAIWVDDALPAGAVPSGEKEGWTWVRLHPEPLSGKAAHQAAIVAGMHQHVFQRAAATLSISVGDRLFAYVYLDPVNKPREVMLQWNDGSWEHRAYWGENLINLGTDDTVTRRHIGPLPPAGQWVRLEVPAILVGLEGRVLNGMAFTLWDGRATWERAGRIARAPMDSGAADRLAPALFFDSSAIDFSSALQNP